MYTSYRGIKNSNISMIDILEDHKISSYLSFGSFDLVALVSEIDSRNSGEFTFRQKIGQLLTENFEQTKFDKELFLMIKMDISHITIINCQALSM